MEAGPRGPYGDTKNIGYLRQAVAKVVMQDNYRAPFRIQLAKGVLELITTRDRAGHVVGLS